MLSLSGRKQETERVGIVCPGEERALGRLYNSFPVLKGSLQERWGPIYFAKACSDSARGSGFKMKEDKFRYRCKEEVFTVRVVRHWNRLP